MLVLLVAVIWICSGILDYGITFAYFQESFPNIKDISRSEDTGFSTFFALSGPIGLIVSFLLSGFAKHGIRFR